MDNPPESPKFPFHAPSARMTAALAAVMLAIGVAVGAAIGPAPSASLAVNELRPLIPLLGARAHQPAPAAPTASAEAPAQPESPVTHRRNRHHAAAAEAASRTSASEESSAPAAGVPTSSAKPKAAALPPVTKVWLIQLAGSGFGEATAQAASAPYLNGQAIPAGTLLSGWSGVDASAFANDATLSASTPPQVLETIVQPACPEGAPGAQCAPGTPGGVAAADAFLKATLPTITATAAYRESGLVVVTFASIASATATGLPAGATSATLTSEPPAGALLISPFTAAGAKSSVAFNPTSPTQSLEKLLRK